MTLLGLATFGWTAYCVYAWLTQSGVWRVTWNLIAANQRATPRPLNVAFISWAFGIAAGLLVGWPLHRLLRPRS